MAWAIVSSNQVNARQHAPSESLSDALLGVGDSWSSFTPLRSNFEAFEAAMCFAQGKVRYIILAGPTGWGKSHLVHAAAEMSVAQGGRGIVVDVNEFLAKPEIATDPRPILIDNAHDVRKKPRDRQKLLSLVEQRLTFRRPTLLCLDEDISGKMLRDLRALSHRDCVARITNPSVEERELLILQTAAKLGLELHRSIARLMARRQEGNAHSIMGALNRLTLGRGPWSGEASLARASGLIFPYLMGADGWDLRDVAYEAVEESLLDLPRSEVEVSQCFCWLMRKVVVISESHLAKYLQTSTSQIYRWTKDCEELQADPEWAERCAKARALLLRKLMV